MHENVQGRMITFGCKNQERLHIGDIVDLSLKAIMY
jgi:hypothetical protein